MSNPSQLFNSEYYHVFTKSIAGFKILKNTPEFERMKILIQYYQYQDIPKLSDFLKTKRVSTKESAVMANELFSRQKRLVKIIAYCFMPTHIHLLLQQISPQGISSYMGNVLNGYTRYFNIKLNRKGPLWQSRFKSVRVATDEQFLHLTRYIHLNPVKAQLIASPDEWEYSSYREYIQDDPNFYKICEYPDLIDMPKESYKQFIQEGVSSLEEASVIKQLILE